jgi:hypothetical protein
MKGFALNSPEVEDFYDVRFADFFVGRVTVVIQRGGKCFRDGTVPEGFEIVRDSRHGA